MFMKLFTSKQKKRYFEPFCLHINWIFRHGFKCLLRQRTLRSQRSEGSDQRVPVHLQAGHLPRRRWSRGLRHDQASARLYRSQIHLRQWWVFLWYLAQEFAAHCICEIPCISTGINICRAGIWTHGSWVRSLNANPVIYYFPSMVRGEKKLQSLIPAFRYQRGSQNNWCLMLRTRYSNSP